MSGGSFAVVLGQGAEHHEAIGWNFRLPFDVPESPTAQPAWRFCGKCNGLFFDGYGEKGACPGGEGHSAIGLQFVIPHDIGDSPNDQPNWHFCGNCYGMVYDGYEDKGKCPKGGVHQPQGYNFVLPHWITPNVSLEPLLGESGRFIRINGSAFTPNSKVIISYDVWVIAYGTRSHSFGDSTDQTSTAGDFSHDLDVEDASGANVAVRDEVTGTAAIASL